MDAKSSVRRSLTRLPAREWVSMPPQPVSGSIAGGLSAIRVIERRSGGAGIARGRGWEACSSAARPCHGLRHDRHSRRGGGSARDLGRVSGGHVVAPVPDGTCGVTAHVALDACAQALPGTVHTTQRDEIPRAQLSDTIDARDVAVYFDTLRVRDRSRLGDIGWLRWSDERSVYPSGVVMPPPRLRVGRHRHRTCWCGDRRCAATCRARRRRVQCSRRHLPRPRRSPLARRSDRGPARGGASL